MAKEEDKNKKVKRPTPLKRDMQNEKRRLRNKVYRSKVKTAVRQFQETLTNGDEKKTQAALNEVYSVLDKCVKGGVFKKNKASRTKSRLAARLAANAA